MTDSDSITKICRDCHRELPLTSFHKNAGCQDGRRPECHDCVKAYRRGYYLKKKVELIAYSKNFYQENKDHALDYQKNYAADNKERIASRHKVWRDANRERLRAKRRAEYIHNMERYALRRRKWAAEHPGYQRSKTHRRRARLREAAGSFTNSQWIAKCLYHGWRCYLCGIEVTASSTHADHRKPISRGGSNWISNIAPSCAHCNHSKSNKTELEYLQFLSRYETLSPLFISVSSN